MAAARRKPEMQIRRTATPQLDITIGMAANRALMQIKGTSCRTGPE
jgi:hypothetical protein